MDLGEGMARLSATVTAAFADAFLNAEDSEDEVATRFAELAQRLLPATASMVVAGYEAYIRDSVQLGMLGPAELESGQAAASRQLAVCFADLVGFTRLGDRLEVHELGSVGRRLADVAGALAEPPVRLVKTIGDAAMFVSSEPAALVGVALALVDAVGREELPALRAGIALGPATVRAGDFYGASVNLADASVFMRNSTSPTTDDPQRSISQDTWHARGGRWVGLTEAGLHAPLLALPLVVCLARLVQRAARARRTVNRRPLLNRSGVTRDANRVIELVGPGA